MLSLGLSLLLCLLSLSLTARAESISGLPPAIEKKIAAKQMTLLQPPFSASKLDRLIKEVQRLTEAQNVRLLKEKENYYIAIDYRARFAEIEFSGIEKKEENELRKSLGIQIGDPFSREKINEAARQLKNYYIERGFLQAEIDIQSRKIPAQDNALLLHIEIRPNAIIRIAKIEVESSNPILNDSLGKALRSFRKDELSQKKLEEIRQEVGKFLRKQRYLQARLEEIPIQIDDLKPEASLKLFVRKPTRYALLFRGNAYFSTREMFAQLQLEEANQSFGDNLLLELEQKILKLYQSQGFAQARVAIQAQEKAEITHLRIQIEEGRQQRIQKWGVTGQISRKERYYIRQLRELASEALQDDIFLAKDLREATESLNIFLQNQGYLSSQVKIEQQSINEQQEVEILLRINEGPISSLKEVSFSGVTAFEKSVLLKQMALEEGAPLNLYQIESSIEKLRNFYLQNAYLDFQLLNEKEKLIRYGKDNQEAYQHFAVYEGDRVKVDEIVITGNEMTKASVIRKTLDFKEGDYLGINEINESELMLQQLGIFAKVDIRPLPPDSAGRRLVLIEVSEREPGVFTLGLGVTDELGGTTKGFTGLVYKNLGGSAKVLQARVEVQNQIRFDNFLENRLILSYMEPLLFGRKWTGRTSLSFFQDVDFLNSDATNTLIREAKRIDFAVEQLSSRHLRYGWNLLSIEGARRFEAKGLLEPERLQIGGSGPYIEVDHRDHLFSPTQGFYTKLALELASPDLFSSTDIHFARTTLVFNQYLPLSRNKDWVFAYSLRGGYVENLGAPGALSIPQERMFFLGGRATVRGFDLAEIPGESDISSLRPAGRTSFFVSDKSSFGLLKLELRFPLYQDFGAAFFYDGGLVDIPEANIPREFRYRDAAGISFRFYTPVGPVSLEYGHKIKQRPGESPGRFHFSIGAF